MSDDLHTDVKKPDVHEPWGDDDASAEAVAADAEALVSEGDEGAPSSPDDALAEAEAKRDEYLAGCSAPRPTSTTSASGPRGSSRSLLRVPPSGSWRSSCPCSTTSSVRSMRRSTMKRPGSSRASR